MLELNKIYNMDNMKGMAHFSDNYFELAIVDPPYGINRSKNFGMKEFGWVQHKRSEWDSEKPKPEYFKELFRISENQIIWGGNYMVEHLKPSMGWVFWDKGQRKFSTSDGELAYTSFNKKLKVFNLSRAGALSDNGGKPIHATQKPIKLYKWLLHNYAKQGDKILDTHSGSASLAIACEWMGFDYIAFETDIDYWTDSLKRLEQERQKMQQIKMEL